HNAEAIVAVENCANHLALAGAKVFKLEARQVGFKRRKDDSFHAAIVAKSYRSDSRGRMSIARIDGIRPPKRPIASDSARPTAMMSPLTTISRTTNLPPPWPLPTMLAAFVP